MVKRSSPIFPNWSSTVSPSPPPSPPAGGGAATNWKFFTEATVTLPWKLRHQHWRCSCHLGALFLRMTWSSFSKWILHNILRGPLDFRRLNLYATWPIWKLPADTWGLTLLLPNQPLMLLVKGLAPLNGGSQSYIVNLVPSKSELQ